MRQEKARLCIQLATQLTDKSHSIHVNGPKYILEKTQLYIFGEKYSNCGPSQLSATGVKGSHAEEHSCLREARRGEH